METNTSSKRSNTRNSWGKGPGARKRKQERAAAHRKELGKADELTTEEYRLKKAEEAIVGGPKGSMAVEMYNKLVGSVDSVTVDIRMGEYYESMAAAQGSKDTGAVEKLVRKPMPDGSIYCLLCSKEAWTHKDNRWSSKLHRQKIATHASLDKLVGMQVKGIRPHAGQTGFRPENGILSQESFIAFWGSDVEFLAMKAKRILAELKEVRWKNSTTVSGKTQIARASDIIYARTGVVSYNESSGRMSYSSQSYCRLAELPPFDVFEPSPHYPVMVLDSPDHGYWPVVEIGIKGADGDTLAQQLQWAKQAEGKMGGSSSFGKSGGANKTDASKTREGEEGLDVSGRLRQIGGVWVIVFCIHQLTWAIPLGWNIPLAPFLTDVRW